MAKARQRTEGRIAQDRDRLLRRVESWLELPMIFLGFVWLILLIVDLTRGLNPFLGGVTQLIWFVFTPYGTRSGAAALPEGMKPPRKNAAPPRVRSP